MSAVGEKVILGRCTNRSRQAGTEFLLQEPNHFAHALEREAPPAKLADDRHGDEFVPTIDTPVSLAAGRYNAPLVPPLQLAGGDSGQRDYVVGCELLLHYEHVLFQTRKRRNV